MAMCLPSIPRQITASSNPQNSEIIQYELAVIQKVIARLCASSDLISRVRQAITMEIISVGKIIAMPRLFQIRHQLTSFKSQKMICMFSILRYRAGITYKGSLSLFMLKIGGGSNIRYAPNFERVRLNLFTSASGAMGKP